MFVKAVRAGIIKRVSKHMVLLAVVYVRNYNRFRQECKCLFITKKY